MRHLVIIASTSALLLAGPSPATAADTQVEVKARKVVINQAYEEIPWNVTGVRAAELETASVTLEHVATRETADFDYDDGPNPSGVLEITDWSQAGAYEVYAEGYDIDYNEVPIDSAFLVAKFASRSKLTGTRDGRAVSLRAVTRKYTGGYPRWAPHRGALVRYQRLAPAGWRTFAKTKANQRGITSVSFNRKAIATYRVVVAPTKTVWGSQRRIKK